MVKRMVRGLVIVSALLLTGRSVGQARQVGADTATVRQHEALVVTAERASTRLALSTGAVSVLDGATLRARPVRTLADALRQVPGMAFVEFDGLGADPQAIVRGFYGGGEADYVLVLLDGRPVNDLETGRIDWSLIPISAIESIEVVRGGASPVWGDAALGGVVNVITKAGARSRRIRIAGGEHGVLRIAGSVMDDWSGGPVSVFADVARSDGYRAHAERNTTGLGATLGLRETPTHTLSLSTVHDWRSVDEPGPLTDVEFANGREGSAPFHRFDNVAARRHRLGVDGSLTGARHYGTARIAVDLRRSDRTRTLPLTPTFADTKNRVITTTRVTGSGQLELQDLLAAVDRLLIGFDASYGRMSSEYASVFQGTPDDYTAAGDQEVGPVTESGRATRTSFAAFASYALQPVPALRLTAGGRLDALNDEFDARAPSEPDGRSASHVAFSPSIGANLRYVDGARHEGNVYTTVGRSFKAPTPDQLFDQRQVPVPFPPFQVSFANDGLEPQYGTSFEVGVYHTAQLSPDAVSLELTLSAYHIDLRDELDFDIESLSYQNIGKSRHRGVEAGVQLRGPGAVRTFANYTLQSATAQSGENDGKNLKAIPRHFVVAGAAYGGMGTGPGASLTVTSARDMPLDDANSAMLPDWTRWDARVSYGLRGFEIHFDVYNLADATYSTTGFPDPAGTGVVYFHPASGRTIEVGLRKEW